MVNYFHLTHLKLFKQKGLLIEAVLFRYIAYNYISLLYLSIHTTHSIARQINSDIGKADFLQTLFQYLSDF